MFLGVLGGSGGGAQVQSSKFKAQEKFQYPTPKLRTARGRHGTNTCDLGLLLRFELALRSRSPWPHPARLALVEAMRHLAMRR